MARARNIKPAFFKNEDLVELPFEYRLLFAGLWTLSDRDGLLEDRPKRIKMEIFPADNVDVEHGLSELERTGFIRRYEADGKKVIWIITFSEHQSPHHTEKSSTLPKPNREITVKEPLNTGVISGDSQQHLRENPPDSLNPDSLKPYKEKTNKKEIPDTGDPANTAVVSLASPDPDSEPGKPPSPVSQHGAIATFVRSQGIHAVSTDQELLNLVKAGATMAHFVDAVPVAKERGKGWKYLLGIVKNMLQDAQAPPPTSTTQTRKGPYDPKTYFQKARSHDDNNTIDADFHVVDEQ